MLKHLSFALVTAGLLTGLAIGPGNGIAGISEFYDSVNGGANYSSGGAFKGQSGNYYSGGSLFIRAPSKRYQLASMSPPSVSFGCNGIDVHKGAFGFINSDELVTFGKNILANAPGAFFQMALQNMCPPCNDILTGMRDLANVVNQANISSCQAAKGLIVAGVEGMSSSSVENNAKLSGAWSGLKGDFSEATSSLFKGGGDLLAGNRMSWDLLGNSAKTSPGAASSVKDAISVGNFTWRAINAVNKKTGELSVMDRRVIMSLIGTYIFPDPASDAGVDSGSRPGPKWHTKTALTMKDFIGSPSEPKALKRPVYSCTDGNYGDDKDSCMSIAPIDTDIDTFYPIVASELNRLYDKISSKNGQWESNERAFIEMADVPVLQILRAASAMPSNSGQIVIQKYAELIASKLAAEYVMQAIQIVRTGLSDVTTREGHKPEARKALEEINTMVVTEMATVHREVARIEANIVHQSSIVDDIRKTVANLHANLPSNVKQNVAFSAGRR